MEKRTLDKTNRVPYNGISVSPQNPCVETLLPPPPPLTCLVMTLGGGDLEELGRDKVRRVDPRKWGNTLVRVRRG